MEPDKGDSVIGPARVWRSRTAFSPTQHAKRGRTSQRHDELAECHLVRRKLRTRAHSARRRPPCRLLSPGELLGTEGDAAPIYFRAFADLLSPLGQAGTTEEMPFQF